MAAETTRSEARPVLRTRRPRTTSPRVRWIDRIATSTITLGGISVIFAVLGILVYLVWVVLPLFSGATVTPLASYPLQAGSNASHVLFATLDEYRQLGIVMLDSGEAEAFDPRTGNEVTRRALFPPGVAATAASRSPGTDRAVFGFGDGTIRLARLGFATSFVTADAVTWPRENGKPADRAIAADGIIERTVKGELRKVAPVIEIAAPISVGTGAVPIRLIDYRAGGQESRMAIYRSDGTLLVDRISLSTNLITGETKSEVASAPVPLPPELSAWGDPAFLLVTSRGDQLYLSWRDGRTVRFDLRDPDRPLAAERTDLLEEPDARLTALLFMPGEQSLVASDSTGRTRVWFRVPRPGVNQDGYSLVAAHILSAHRAPITAVAVSSRDKTVLTGAADGSIILHHMTSEQKLAEFDLVPGDAVIAAQITPKGDGVFALSSQGHAEVWGLRNSHPETSFASVLGKIWYEGYPRPDFTWQSSSGTDDFEPKLSLVPLIFGTFKATFYSMLFAVPIALCGAIYTSEFLDRRYRAILKSVVELMASLPSVVLGFIAALVLAPLVENWVLAVLAAFALIPLAALSLGYVWQMLPQRVALPLSGRPQFFILLVLVIACLWIAGMMAAPLESALFAGDFKGWLDGRTGSGAPGIAILAWPLVAIGLLVLDRRVLAEIWSRTLGSRSRGRAALSDFVRYLILITLSFFLAWAIAIAGAAMGFDPRGDIFGTYVQRNALIVGFVMGFAVIPIIYTIAEDALSAVPQTLRSASLGCGATRWQTATRVVLPVAVSGIFSALMIGLGRAVGETMIVLMAAGNTPIIDFNVFNGLRTLSANIAVELPEAVKDGTLYRMLFLAALLLFMMTFIVNSVAEVIRQRFRRRADQL